MALEVVWNEYREALSAFIHSRVSDSLAAEDILQDVLVKVHEQASSLKQVSSLKAWVFQIANHAVIDYYRARAKDQKGLEQLPDTELLNEQEDDVMRDLLGACIKPFVHALSDDSAALLNEIELKGRKQKELALEQGIAYSTLKSRVQKSRAELKDLFQQCCDFTYDHQGNLMDFEPRSDFQLKPTSDRLKSKED